MILLFNSKASKATTTNKTSNVKNHPVENSGILAMGLSDAKSLLTMGEYDSYVSSSPVAINYAMYSDFSDGNSVDSGFMSSFSSAVAVLGDSGFSSGASSCEASSYSGGASFSSCSSSSGSFASVC